MLPTVESNGVVFNESALSSAFNGAANAIAKPIGLGAQAEGVEHAAWVGIGKVGEGNGGEGESAFDYSGTGSGIIQSHSLISLIIIVHSSFAINIQLSEVPGTPTETNRLSSADESSIVEETVVKENGDAIKSPGRKPDLKPDLSAANPVFLKANVSKEAETNSASSLSNYNSLHQDDSSQSPLDSSHLDEAGSAASHDSDDQPSSQDSSLHSDSEEEMMTPRLDTGKASASTPPIEHEKVLVRFRGKLALSSTGASFTDTSESERHYDSAEAEAVPGMSLSFLLLLFSFSLPLAHPNRPQSRSYARKELRRVTLSSSTARSEGASAFVDNREIIPRQLLEAMVERPPSRNVNEEGLNLDKDVISPGQGVRGLAVLLGRRCNYEEEKEAGKEKSCREGWAGECDQEGGRRSRREKSGA
ncbi:hypothetical protein C8J56DRAFT_897248 [Mycena floridula]|nr:hypothetical protein C8J56DRAFT_897248 [Mycena floridula]